VTSGAGRNAILVVEDEPLVRALAVDILEDAGLEGIEAPNSDLPSSSWESGKTLPS